jgi:hypothetical protein
MKMFRRYTKLAAASKEIVRTDIPHTLLPAFVELARKVKTQPMKSVGFEMSAEFDPNDPDFAYVQAAVRAALEASEQPARSARSATKAPGGATSPSSAATGASPTGGATPTSEAVPSRLSDATEDCAYRPVADTSTSG